MWDIYRERGNLSIEKSIEKAFLNPFSSEKAILISHA